MIGLDPIITDNPDGFDFLGLYPVQELGIKKIWNTAIGEPIFTGEKTKAATIP
ncbi:MAG: hypothetical protein H8E00_00725 [Deltaproteobacteria bacterium]|nr:hypothetical protein [Deltaproteobacteria bacterium]